MQSEESSVVKETKDTVRVNPEDSNLSDESPRIQRRLLTPFMSKKVPRIPTEDERKVYPLRKANILSRIFFWWLLPVIRVGYKRTLQPLDLWYLDEKLQIEFYYSQFETHLEKQISQSRLDHAKVIEAKKQDGTYNSEEDDEFAYPKYSILWALLNTFKWEYSLSILCITIANCGFTLNPLLSKALINFVEKRAMNQESNVGKGIGYALGVSFIILASGIFINHFMHFSMMVGAKVKAVLTKAMLDKSFKLNAKGKQKFPAGKITSIMGTDLARIDLAIGFQPFALGFPIPVGISILLLIVNIGVAALVGIGIFIISVGLIGMLTRNLFKYRKAAIKFTDLRVGYMKELLNNLKVIKFYSWEDSYDKTVANVRTKEMQTIFKMQVMRSTLTSFAITLPQLSSMASFLVLYAIADGKNAADIFSSLSLFNGLAQQIIMVPMALASGSDALIGVLRVTELLQCGEVNELEQHLFHENLEELIEEDLAIKVDDASFEWRSFTLDEEELEQLEEEKKLTKATPVVSKLESSKSAVMSSDGKEEGDITSSTFSGLNNINLDVKLGEFIVITGMIGSGKSSLLNAMAGFMHKSSGVVKVNGSLLMCGQPWVQNATVKDNILFGETYDAKKYKDVIYACSLDADLDILPAGDNTEIGERGITLSGGQKLRINLARAVYADRDIILLDDVLSAVDARVGKHIMDECIMGLLSQKTRILATHQLSLIGSANRVIFLNGDGSMDVGTVDELNARNEGFANLMSFNAEAKDEEEDDFVEDEIQDEEKELIRKQTLQDEEVRRNFEQRVGNGTLMSKEDRAVNGINFLVYKRYVQLGSGIFKAGIVPIFVLLVMLTTFCQLFTNTWLSFWTEFKFHDKSNGFYIGFYVMFTILTMIFAGVEFTLIVYIANRAARALNIMAVQRLLKLPMAFMDTTPMGRILNRFTKDTDSLDNEISEQLRLLIYPMANIIGVLILCIIYLPWFAIAIPFLVAIYVSVSSLYQASGREIKRLELIQRSFVYSNFNETLNGLPTIKAYKLENRFMEKNNFLINKMNEAYFITIANQRWLAIHLDMVACVLSIVISILCVTRQFHIAPASVGLLLSYVLQIAGQLSLLIRAMTQVENEMNSVERLCHYAYELEQELPFEISSTKPRPSWPENGEIDFNNVSLAYRPGLPLVLKNMSMHVGAGEKIGICGRTGAGKSSIMTALFRISEMDGGSIIIDGIDIGKIGLHDLRSKLSIIPQDPVLFRGTIRKNLDPFSEQSDEWLWQSLKRAGLVDDIATVKAQKTDLHKFHLDQVVEDDGANFSLGERQLIALARAVVRNSKILILDEATSSVDYETDSKIQSTIVREFGHCTILCIAHRLKTIADYDKILVLDKGEVKEFDTPWHLFNLDGGIFQSMCQRSNMTSEDFKRKD